MKLLLISAKSENAAGGIAVWTNHYLSHCTRHGIDCSLVNTEVSARGSSNGILRFWNEFLRTCRIVHRLKSAVKNDSYDFAHLNTSCGPFGLYRDYLIARWLFKRKIPFALHYHCDIPFWVKTDRRRHVLKKMASLASLNMVLCENSRVFLANMNVASTKVPNFIEESSLTDAPKKTQDTLTRISFVGRISRNKGAAEIYKLAKDSPHITFTLAGSIISPVDSWPKPENIKLTGSITHDEVLHMLDDSDLFLFPSHSEGFSMALMEAMARGVPCLAYDSVGANEDMLADNCGVTVPFGDIRSLAQAISNLEDPAIRKQISENALNKVKSQYTTDAVLTLFKKLYESKL